jgi:hypothetical protein
MNAIVLMSLGIGDMAFAEPGIRLLLNAGVKTVHLFARRDGLKLYHNYTGVQVYPLEATNNLLQLQKLHPCVVLNDRSHPFYNYTNRVTIFSNAIAGALGLPMVREYSAPVLPVADQNIEWAEMYANKRPGEKLIIWQMDASRPYKTIPTKKSLQGIQRLSENGCRVLAMANNHNNLPRLPNVKWMRGVSIDRFMGLCAIADRVVAHDSAPAWIAAAVGAEVLAVFGPTNPKQFAIRSDNVKVLRWMADRRCYQCGSGCNTIECLSALPDDVLYQAASEGVLPVQEQYPETTWEDFSTAAIILTAPQLGGGKKLAATIESLLRQKYRNFDLVVGEVSGSGVFESLLSEYAMADDRIQVIRMPSDTTAQARLNALSEYAAHVGHLHTFIVEAGDVWESDELSRRLYSRLRGE